MTPELLAAILNAVTKFGFDSIIALLESRGSTLDDTIEALKKARDKSLQDYIDEDAAKKLVAATAPLTAPSV